MTLSVSVTGTANNFEIDLYNSGKKIDLHWIQKQQIYSSTTSYLSSCIYLDNIIGRTVEQEEAKKSLNAIKSGKYVELYRADQRFSLPIRAGQQEIDRVYLRVTESNLPDLVTVTDDKIQLYAKCQGGLAIIHFSCNAQMALIFGFEMRTDWCEQFMDPDSPMHKPISG